MSFSALFSFLGARAGVAYVESMVTGCSMLDMAVATPYVPD